MQSHINLTNIENTRSKFISLNCNQDIADLLEVKLSTLIYYVYRLSKSDQYSSFTIHKRNGGKREISAPISNLKIIQSKLNSILQLLYTPRDSVYGFRKNRNIIKNAFVHKNSQLILKIDLKDFFNQIHFGRIKGLFMAPYPFNFNELVASTLANICVYKEILPQGAPTSPILSNMICWRLDRDMEIIAKKFKCKYTRYADDITFSTKYFNFAEQVVKTVGENVILGDELQSVFNNNQFNTNSNKLHIFRKNKRQMVTGLIVNEFVNVKREYIRDIRRNLFIWEKFGIQSLIDKMDTKIDSNPFKTKLNLIWKIGGQINFIKQVKGKDNKTFKKIDRWFNYLKIKEKFYVLSQTNDYQNRGYGLEDIINKLCLINDIECRSPFSRITDQIDGAIFTTHGVMSVECKWTNNNDEINKEIDIFQNKITQRSGQNNYGIFISMAGWNDNAISRLIISTNKNIVLMNKEDLETIILNRNFDVKKFLELKIHKLITENIPYTPTNNLAI